MMSLSKALPDESSQYENLMVDVLHSGLLEKVVEQYNGVIVAVDLNWKYCVKDFTEEGLKLGAEVFDDSGGKFMDQFSGYEAYLEATKGMLAKASADSQLIIALYPMNYPKSLFYVKRHA